MHRGCSLTPGTDPSGAFPEHGWRYGYCHSSDISFVTFIDTNTGNLFIDLTAGLIFLTCNAIFFKQPAGQASHPSNASCMRSTGSKHSCSACFASFHELVSFWFN